MASLMLGPGLPLAPARRPGASARGRDAVRAGARRTPPRARLPLVPLPQPKSIRVLLCGGGDGPGTRDAAIRAADAAYEVALELSRQQHYGAAREAFEALLRSHPDMCKAWVSYAQMEKRVGRLGDPQRFEIARYILQRGLSVNPGSACLAQAWGLLELQRGNWWAAVRLLERCVVMEPANAPVLRWQPVRSARQTLGGRSTAGRRGASVVPAAGGGGGGGGGAGGGAMSSRDHS